MPLGTEINDKDSNELAGFKPWRKKKYAIEEKKLSFSSIPGAEPPTKIG